MRRARERAGLKTPVDGPIPQLPDELRASIHEGFLAAIHLGQVSVDGDVLDAWDKAIEDGTLDASDLTVMKLLMLDGMEDPDGRGVVRVGAAAFNDPRFTRRLAHLKQAGWVSKT